MQPTPEIKADLWESLGLTLLDGMINEEQTPDGYVIVLTLWPDAMYRVQKIYEWCGFPVIYQCVKEIV